MSKHTLLLAIVVAFWVTQAGAFIPLPFKTLAGKADKIAVVEIVEIERTYMRVKVKDAIKGQFRSKEILIRDTANFAVGLRGDDRKLIKPGATCLVLLSFLDTAVSPFGLSACGGHSILILKEDRVLAGRYGGSKDMTPAQIIKELKAKYESANPTTRPLDLSVGDFDRSAAPSAKLETDLANAFLKKFLKADRAEATAIAKKLIVSGLTPDSVARFADGQANLEGEPKQRLTQLHGDLLIVRARRELLQPKRAGLRIEAADAQTSLDKLSKTYDWPMEKLHKSTRRFLAGTQISVDLKSASSMEALAAICRQTGLTVYEGSAAVGISGAIGEEEHGGRNLTLAQAGLLIQLDPGLTMAGNEDWSLGVNVVSSIPWYRFRWAMLEVSEFVYADGSKEKGVAVGVAGARIPLEALARNKGKIKLIKGKLVVPIPLAAERNVVAISTNSTPKKLQKGHYFLELTEFKKKRKGWQVSYEYGVSAFSLPIGVEKGCARLLGADGMPTVGKYLSSGGGFSGGSGIQRSVSRRTVLLAQPPKALEWTYVVDREYHTIDLQFEDVQLPPIIWKKTKARR